MAVATSPKSRHPPPANKKLHEGTLDPKPVFNQMNVSYTGSHKWPCQKSVKQRLNLLRIRSYAKAHPQQRHDRLRARCCVKAITRAPVNGFACIRQVETQLPVEQEVAERGTQHRTGIEPNEYQLHDFLQVAVVPIKPIPIANRSLHRLASHPETTLSQIDTS